MRTWISYSVPPESLLKTSFFKIIFFCTKRESTNPIHPIRSPIRSAVRTSRLTESGNRAKNFQLTRDPRYFSNPRIRSIYRRNPQSVSFLRPNPPIRGPIHHPPLCSLFHVTCEFHRFLHRGWAHFLPFGGWQVYPASSGFSRSDATLRWDRNHCEQPFAFPSSMHVHVMTTNI